MSRTSKTTYTIQCDRCPAWEEIKRHDGTLPVGWMGLSTSRRFTDAAGAADTSQEKMELCKECSKAFVAWAGLRGEILYANVR